MSEQPQPNAAERRAHERALERYRVMERIFVLLGPTIVVGAVLAFLGYHAAKAIDSIGNAWAGKTTHADISLAGSAALNTGPPSWCYWAMACLGLLAAIGIGYGWHERALRRAVTHRLSERPAILEQRIDPDRTSSGIPRDGSTPEETR